MLSTHVFMTADAVGGVWTYVVDLARALSDRGIRITLAILGPQPSKDQADQAATVPGLRLLDADLRLDWLATDPDEIAVAADRLHQLARSCGAEVIHLNSPILAAGQRYSVPVVGVSHSCLMTWWRAVGGGAMPRELTWHGRMMREGLLRCHMTVVPSAAYADAVAQAYDVPRPVVVHNGRYDFPLTDKVFATERIAVTAGRLWDRGKNVGTLERAAARLDFPLLAVGAQRGPDGSAVTFKHAKALGVLPGHDLYELLRRSPIFVSAARYEPFGLAVLEAALAGCALILSDIPTFRELWRGAAIFIAPNDAAAFARAVQSLADHPAQCQELAAAARQRAGQFTAERMCDAMIGIYKRARFAAGRGAAA